MSTAPTLKQANQYSPRTIARMAGAAQLLAAITTTFGQNIIPGKLTVSGNAAVTAANILTREPLVWLGFALALLGVVFHLAWGSLSYELFKVVNRRIALFALVIMIAVVAAQLVTAILYLGPQFILTSSGSVFPAEQAQALAYALFRFSSYTFSAQLFFFGLWCVLLAVLVLRSRFLPRVLGVLLGIAGCGWMLYLVPPLGFHLFPYIAAASALGEIPLELWLMARAVNSQRWDEQATATAHWR